MRIEKGYRAMGHELDTDVTPLEAGLDFAVAWDTDFIGREALLRRRDKGIESRVATILLDDTQAVPLGSEPVYANDMPGGRIVGKTTSAAFGYRIGKPVALAFLNAAIGEGDLVEIDIARHMWTGRVTLQPAFDPTGARMRAVPGARS
jgi:glycine cleavage system aminomethyltransferase T